MSRRTRKLEAKAQAKAGREPSLHELLDAKQASSLPTTLELLARTITKLDASHDRDKQRELACKLADWPAALHEWIAAQPELALVHGWRLLAAALRCADWDVAQVLHEHLMPRLRAGAPELAAWTAAYLDARGQPSHEQLASLPRLFGTRAKPSESNLAGVLEAAESLTQLRSVLDKLERKSKHERAPLLPLLRRRMWPALLRAKQRHEAWLPSLARACMLAEGHGEGEAEFLLRGLRLLHDVDLTTRDGERCFIELARALDRAGMREHLWAFMHGRQLPGAKPLLELYREFLTRAPDFATWQRANALWLSDGESGLPAWLTSMTQRLLFEDRLTPSGHADLGLTCVALRHQPWPLRMTFLERILGNPNVPLDHAALGELVLSVLNETEPGVPRLSQLPVARVLPVVEQMLAAHPFDMHLSSIAAQLRKLPRTRCVPPELGWVIDELAPMDLGPAQRALVERHGLALVRHHHELLDVILDDAQLSLDKLAFVSAYVGEPARVGALVRLLDYAEFDDEITVYLLRVIREQLAHNVESLALLLEHIPQSSNDNYFVLTGVIALCIREALDAGVPPGNISPDVLDFVDRMTKTKPAKKKPAKKKPAKKKPAKKTTGQLVLSIPEATNE
jgi:hypothetical protein